MRSFIPLSALAFAVVRAEWGISPTPEESSDLEIARYIPEISVIDANKSYVVKLDCVGCPSISKNAENGYSNALRLQFNIENPKNSDATLLLNGHRIMPLDPMPLSIITWQVPANLTTDAEDKFLLSPSSGGAQLEMAFEHTVLRTQEGGQTWIQFDVTGITLGDSSDAASPTGGDKELVKLDKNGQKLVQIRLQVNSTTKEVSIEEIQVVEREHRAQPYRMKCGRLAMSQTRYDPSEWDQYGKIGSWSRSLFQAISFFDVQQNPLVLPLALMLALVTLLVRRWSLRGQQDKAFVYDDEAQVALLEFDDEDLTPAYAVIPVIKIEEYD